MDKLLFGTAGVPESSKKKTTPSGVEKIAELGLGCMELEFVHGVRMNDETAGLVNSIQQELGVALSVHAPYYINLNSLEEEKRKSSVERVVNSAIVGKKCGADRVTFHPAFYHEMSSEECLKNVKPELEKILSQIPQGIRIDLETTGKLSAFGTVEEILALCNELPGLSICVDFSHLYARSLGEFNHYKNFATVIEKLGKQLPGYLKDVHFHVSGINFGKKGELNHLPLEESGLNWKDLVKVFSDYQLAGLIICESPILEKDALLLQNYYRSIC
mgnify:CR=1 FL=1